MSVVGAEVSADLALLTKAGHPRQAVSSGCIFPRCLVTFPCVWIKTPMTVYTSFLCKFVQRALGETTRLEATVIPT